MLTSLNGPIGVFGTGQQGALAGLFWRQRIKFPTAPRMPSRSIEKMRFGPALAAVSAHRDLCQLRLTCPCSAEDGVGMVGNRVS